MSFTCEFCGKPTASGVKPVKVILETQTTKQYGWGEDDEPKVYESVGPVAEFKQCPECAGIEIATKAKPNSKCPPAFSFAEIAVDNLVIRAAHTTKRSIRDFSASYPVLKTYEQRGGGL